MGHPQGVVGPGEINAALKREFAAEAVDSSQKPRADTQELESQAAHQGPEHWGCGGRGGSVVTQSRAARTAPRGIYSSLVPQGVGRAAQTPACRCCNYLRA